MAYQFRNIEKTIGAFIVIAFLLFIGAIIFIAKGQKLIAKKNYYTTIFNSAGNLSEGMKVKFKGLQIGTVKKLYLNNSNNVVVEFHILREYADRIKKDSVVQINAPLIGEKTMEITSGTRESEQAQNNSLLYSVDTSEGLELLSSQVSRQPTSPSDLIIQNVQLLTAQLSNPSGPFMRTLRNLQQFSSAFAGENKRTINIMIKDLQATTANFKELSKAMKDNPFFGGWSGDKKSKKK
ncbi:MAG: MCE family protein [Spirochaetes bacterium]|nr:MCE family protein [Spirochaetota bacterium]